MTVINTPCILAIDQGTTSSRAITFDHEGRILYSAQQEFKQYFPENGWVEHDALELWGSQRAVVEKVASVCRNIKAVGITNQRETTIVWNRLSGKPVCNAIVWQDRRTAEFCEELKQQGLAEKIRLKTGLLLDSYFSATKLHWILAHIPNARKQAEAGELAFGTVDTWLLWNLTGGKVHATDASNAARTMLYNIIENSWDAEILELLDIPHSLLPEVKASSDIYATIQLPGSKQNVPVAGIIGDQQAALFGQSCLQPGMLKNTYGTGSFIMMNTGSKPVFSSHQLLTTVAWNLDGTLTYALEGANFTAGAVVQWLRDGLGLIKAVADVEQLALTEKDSGGVYLVPAFAGLGAPYWDEHARGTIVGMTRGTRAGHIARAALEGMAFQVHDVLKAMRLDSGLGVPELRVDGGAAVNDTFMQCQADILQIPIIRPKIVETTALGAAFMAGLAIGFWPSIEKLAEQWQEDRSFEPHISVAEAAARLKVWEKAVGRASGWLE